MGPVDGTHGPSTCCYHEQHLCTLSTVFVLHHSFIPFKTPTLDLHISLVRPTCQADISIVFVSSPATNQVPGLTIELPLPTEKLSWKADDFGKMSALPRLWSPTTAVLPLLQQCHDWQMIDLTSVYQYDLSLSLAAAWLHREYARNSQNCKNATASTRQNFVPVMSCLPSPQQPINSFQQALSHESPR